MPTEGMSYAFKKPDGYLKNGRVNAYTNYLPFELENGDYYVFFQDVRYKVLATVHTHPVSGRADFGDMYGVSRSGDWRSLVGSAIDIMYVI